MFVRRLRTKIAINLAMLLLLAMVLIDLVSMVTVRRELIRSEISKADLLLALLRDNLPSGSVNIGAKAGLETDSLLTAMINDSQIVVYSLLTETTRSPFKMGLSLGT